jgi:hypothetical protein
MTSQLLEMSNPASTLSSAPSTVANPARVSDATVASPSRAVPVEPVKSPYKADQQVKFLHLQAEVESLLLQLRSLKPQRQDQAP